MQLGGYGLWPLLYAMASKFAPRVLRLPVFLLAMNAAFAVVFCGYVTDQYAGSWKRTERT